MRRGVGPSSGEGDEGYGSRSEKEETTVDGYRGLGPTSDWSNTHGLRCRGPWDTRLIRPRWPGPPGPTPVDTTRVPSVWASRGPWTT